MLLHLPEIPWGSLLGFRMVEDVLISLWGVPMTPTPPYTRRTKEVVKLPAKVDAFRCFVGQFCPQRRG